MCLKTSKKSNFCPLKKKSYTPAVHNEGPLVLGVAVLDPPQKHEEGGGGVGHAVVRPRRELELTDLAPLQTADLKKMTLMKE